MSKHRQRIEKLEQDSTDLRFVFVMPGETEQEALARVGEHRGRTLFVKLRSPDDMRL